MSWQAVVPLSLVLSTLMLRTQYSRVPHSSIGRKEKVLGKLMQDGRVFSLQAGSTSGVGSCGGRGAHRLPAKSIYLETAAARHACSCRLTDGVLQTLRWFLSWPLLVAADRQIRVDWVMVFLVSRLPQAAANVVAEGFLEGKRGGVAPQQSTHSYSNRTP